jgi:hypothetical protein
MNKNGQSTIFIIIGIVIVLLVVLGFVFKDNFFGSLSEELVYPGEVQEVVDYVQGCVDDSSYGGVVHIGLNGGYYYLPENSFYYGLSSLPYYYHNGNNLMPTLEEIETQLDDYLEFEVFYCINSFDFSDLNVSFGDLSVSSLVNNNSVDFFVYYPFEVFVGDLEYEVYDPYEVSIDANLGWLFSVAENIVEYDMENQEEIDLEFLLDQGVSNIQYAFYNNETVIYLLEDTTSFEGQENYTFMFAAYYPIPEEYYDLNENDFWEGFI